MTAIHRNTTRRNFLTQALFGWLTLIFLPIIYIIMNYIIPPKLKEKIFQVLNVGKITDVPENSAKIVKFNKIPIVLVHTSENQLKAFSAVCTHLGCIIEYHEDEKRFHCNCHGSIFDINGKNIGGPAPKPLIPYRVELKENNIMIYKS